MKAEASGREVWVWVEHYQGKPAPVSLALLGKARVLSQELGAKVAAVLVAGDSEISTPLIAHGADKVYMAAKPVSLFDTEACATAIAEFAQKYTPEIVLWGATSLGRETASRAAAKLGTGLTAHCIDLHIANVQGQKVLVAVVGGWGGNAVLKIVCPEKRPQMATVRPGIFALHPPQKRDGEVIYEEIDIPQSRLDIIEVAEHPTAGSNLEQADVVVAGGWGLSSMGGFAKAEELAGVLGGVAAGTRPALDASWIPAERMIGQSGRTVAPRLLITLGVSGAAQFAAAVTGSKLIVAVDSNPKAPIFEMADIGIVGDLREVLPLLIEKLKDLKKKD